MDNIDNFIYLYIFFAIMVLIYYRVAKDRRHEFMRKFAKENNYNYQEKGYAEGCNSPYLQAHHNGRAENIISGVYKGYPITIFNFHYTGQGGNNIDLFFTACKIQYYKNKLPQIFLDSHHRNILTDDPSVFSKFSEAKRIIKLEGDFNEYFTLYVPEDYEMEVLQIFSIDIMEKLKNKGKIFSLEFVDNHIFIYSRNVINNKKFLYEFYNFMQFLIIELVPRIERLKK